MKAKNNTLGEIRRALIQSGIEVDDFAFIIDAPEGDAAVVILRASSLSGEPLIFVQQPSGHFVRLQLTPSDEALETKRLIALKKASNAKSFGQ